MTNFEKIIVMIFKSHHIRGTLIPIFWKFIYYVKGSFNLPYTVANNKKSLATLARFCSRSTRPIKIDAQSKGKNARVRDNEVISRLGGIRHSQKAARCWNTRTRARVNDARARVRKRNEWAGGCAQVPLQRDAIRPYILLQLGGRLMLRSWLRGSSAR